MLPKLLISTIFCCFWHQVLGASPGTSEAPTPEQSKAQETVEISRDSALSLYQNKNFAQSAEVLHKLIQKESKQPDLHYNLFINYLASKQLGKGLRHLRTSFELEPGYKPSMDSISSLPTDWSRRFYRKQSFFQRFSLQIHYYVGLQPMLWVLILVSVLFLRNLIRALKDLKENSQVSGLLSTRLAIFGITLLVCLCVVFIKLYQQNTQRLSLLKASSAHVTPNSNSPKILDLLEGELIQIKEEKGDWLRIEDYDGKQAWIQKTPSK